MGPQPLETEPKAASAVDVILDPVGTVSIKASTSDTESDKVVQSKLITPSEKLANIQCDFIEEV